jgi:hypothetical protein
MKLQMWSVKKMSNEGNELFFRCLFCVSFRWVNDAVQEPREEAAQVVGAQAIHVLRAVFLTPNDSGFAQDAKVVRKSRFREAEFGADVFTRTMMNDRSRPHRFTCHFGQIFHNFETNRVAKRV